MSAAFFRLPKVVCAQIVGTDHFSFIVIRICIIGFAVCFRIDDLRCVFFYFLSFKIGCFFPKVVNTAARLQLTGRNSHDSF